MSGIYDTLYFENQWELEQLCPKMQLKTETGYGEMVVAVRVSNTLYCQTFQKGNIWQIFYILKLEGIFVNICYVRHV